MRCSIWLLLCALCILLLVLPSQPESVSRKGKNAARFNRARVRDRDAFRLRPAQSVLSTATVNRFKKPKGRLGQRRVNQGRVKIGRRRRPSSDVLSARRTRPGVLKKPDQVTSLSSSQSVQIKGNEKPYKIVCYYTNWSQYRPKKGKFMPENIDPFLCTHIIFAFGWMKKGRLSAFETNDETKEGKPGLYEKVVNLKKINPDLKILLALGGWSFGTKKFKEMSKTRYTRQNFIFSAIPYLRERDFDGFDLDWEYPKGADDKRNFVLLLKELREAFDAEAQEYKRPRLLLSAAVPVGPDNVRGGYDVPAVASYLDFINLMAYDFHGKWESQTGHNAPLFAPSSDSNWRKQLCVTHAADMWVRLGAPKNKLVIGMPTYGRSFTLANKRKFGVNVPTTGGGKAGTYSREGGFLTYYEVCEMLRNGAAYVWDDEMKVPYAIQEDQWVGFDDERAIRNKMVWLKKEGYAGAMVWSLDMDDFTGSFCGGGKYPLIGAMREELHGTPREGNFKDVDWSKVARAPVIEPELPKAENVPIEEILQNYLKLQGKTATLETPLIALPNLNVDAPNVICYYTSWSPKRPGAGRFEPELLDVSLCTHMVYAFATLKENLLAPAEEGDLGDSYTSGNYARVMKLKEKNPNLKVLLAVGGWAFGSKPFRELTSNVFRMNNFVYEALDFLRLHKFDGLDIDWEYPRGQSDKEKFTTLVRELRTAFEGEAEVNKAPRLILSAAVPASFEAVAAGYDVPEISKYLDLINVMTYDFHGQWERQVGHNSPLYPLESASTYQKKLTVEFSALEWIRQGAPKEKILIGMPTYGRSFTLVDPVQFDIGAPASGGGLPGEFTGETGFLAYYEICEFLRQDNVTLVWDSEQQVPFAYRGDQWVGFDDDRSFKTKTEWLRKLGFGGVMVWSVDLDDFRGSCGMGKYPLLNALKTGLSNYTVVKEYVGPFDSPEKNRIGGSLATKDPTEVVCEEADGHISYHKDESDCRMYYMCEGERKHHMPCPANLVFNANENVCDWPENVVDCQAFTQAPPPER